MKIKDETTVLECIITKIEGNQNDIFQSMCSYTYFAYLCLIEISHMTAA